MTTPTEELAKRVGLHWHILKSEEAGQKLQAFREAVEAESDAERMKQEPYGWFILSSVMGWDFTKRKTVADNAKENGCEVTALYANPPVPDGKVIVDAHVLNFLNGESDIDGVWFGEEHPQKRGRFWWRRLLPNPMLKAAQQGE